MDRLKLIQIIGIEQVFLQNTCILFNHSVQIQNTCILLSHSVQKHLTCNFSAILSRYSVHVFCCNHSVEIQNTWILLKHSIQIQ